jgi:hypothetical protein
MKLRCYYSIRRRNQRGNDLRLYMRPIHDPSLFAIGSDLFLVVAAAVVGDFEDFVSDVFA